ncbi:patatin-like phospholipase family protein [Caldimonas sp.]|uniref:patatin-like phospholipase family protein n=1 Tax=Caldimonas sp. TaxID=2838790 RepID=UPI00391A0200
MRLAACLIAALLSWPALAAPQTVVAAAGEPSRPRIGLVLSGGGARGGAHIGVLRALEELRVPVDLIVGTSAGAIVGAAYASGLPLPDIEQEMQGLSTGSLFRDLRRTDEPYRRKLDDSTNYIGPEVGVRADGLALPKGAVSGVSLEAVLRRLTRRQTQDDFDHLPVPYRAVATDLVSGEMVVLSRGSLAQAARASMAVPGAVTPVEIDGRLLVDGGLTRNLPVDLARQLGADIVIAVNVGTPLLRREDISSILSVTEQVIGILTHANVRQSLSELKESDILITPDLADLSSAHFDRLSEAVQRGESAAQAARERLSRLSLPPPVYESLMIARFQGERRTPARIDEIRVTGTDKVNPAVVRAAMTTREGDAFDSRRLDDDMKRIYARGDFESVNYTLVEENGRSVLVTEVTEKPWGPNYLRFGLALSSDFRGNAYFNLLGTHRWSWLNERGAEWRNDIQVGRNDLVRSEWHQPLDTRQTVFASVHALLQRDPLDIFSSGGRKRLVRLRRTLSGAGADLGLTLGTAGEVRLGLFRGRLRLSDDTNVLAGLIALPQAQMGATRLQLGLDTLDNSRFPRTGYAAEFSVYASHPRLGASDRYTKAYTAATKPLTLGVHTVMLSGFLGRALGDHALPDYELFTLGGFQRLSGYQTGELTGTEVGYGRINYNVRLTQADLFDGAYIGLSLEAGRIGESAFGANRTSLRRGGSIYFAFDSPLGPVYLAYGQADGGRRAAYFFLGRP